VPHRARLAFRSRFEKVFEKHNQLQIDDFDWDLAT